MSTEPSLYGPPPMPPPPRQSPKVLLLIIGVVVAVGAGVGVAAALGAFSGSSIKAATTFTLSGSITLNPSTGAYSVNEVTYAAGSCQGTGPYSDISPGVAVLVADPQGHTVATGSLEAGIQESGDNGPCKLPFDVPNVPLGLASYSVTISHRGTQVVSSAEAHTGVNLTLGSN